MDNSMSDLVGRGRALFESKFGSSDDCAVVFAPGRVNLIGEHTDYNGGFVMPLALNKRTIAVGKGRVSSKSGAQAVCRVVSEKFKDEVIHFNADGTLAPGEPTWANYIKGVVAAYLCDVPPGHSLSFDAAIVSDVPLGAGVSSSAALEVAMATLLEEVLEKNPGGVEKALRCQSSDHKFLKCPCGIMDQFASVLARQGCTLLVDCASNKYETVPLDDPGVVVVVANSGVTHKHSDGAYGERVAQCAEAVQMIQKQHPEVKQLRDARQEWVEEIKKAVGDKVYRRATHVVSEDRRTLCCMAALRRRDYNIIGDCMNMSHTSLRDDYEVSCDELDCLVDIALGVPGVFGSRMTGGGFGGCTVTLVTREAADNLIEVLKEEYKKKTSLECNCFVTEAHSGAGVLVPSRRARSLGDVVGSLGSGNGAGTVLATVMAVVGVTAVALFSMGKGRS